jgi:YHS domain-containing protein
VNTRMVVIAVVLVTLTAGACGRGPGQPAADQEAAVLAKADAADGAVDTVVSKCAVCSLAMEGDAAYSSTYAGYTFHLCSAHCKETFDHDPAKVLARLD